MSAPAQAFESFARPPRVHLEVLSNSAIATFRRCPREFKYAYLWKRRSRRVDEALRFGSFFHVGLNAWWQANFADPESKLEAALMAMRQRAEERPEDADEYELAKAEALIVGYTVRWGHEIFSTVAVEKKFDVPIVNPETGRPSKTYRLQGAIDAIAVRPGSKKTFQIEHKTTSSDITAGADYWRKVSALDPQVSTYQVAMTALGYAEVETLYDVVRKVGLKPYKATPEEKRTWTKEKSKQCAFCKKAGNIPGPHRVSAEGEPEAFCVDGRIITEPSRLHADVRENDETVDEFRERVTATIAADPEKYFARGPIVRLEHDQAEHARDVWQTTGFIRESENANTFPRSPNACERFHRLCSYFDVCSGNASIDDESRFRTAEHAHEELVNKEV